MKSLPVNPPRRARHGWSVIEITVVIVGLGTLLGIVAFAYLKYKDRANERICYAQQHRLQKNIDGLGLASLDVPFEEILAQLVSAGYIRGDLAGGEGKLVRVELLDPGGGQPSHLNYLLLPGSKLVGCRRHGSALSPVE